jgi:hypothetical protein
LGDDDRCDKSRRTCLRRTGAKRRFHGGVLHVAEYTNLWGVHLLNHSVKRTANPTGSEIGRIKPHQHSGISFGPTESVKQVG